jgi:hypothetical protein
MKHVLSLCLATAIALASPLALAYPLDGYPTTGIKRLEAYRMAAQGARRPSFLTAGEMLPSAAIGLRLVDEADFGIPAPDPDLSARIKEMLGRDAPYYGIAVLDYSEPSRPRYAAHNSERPQNPGSVGKIAVLLAWFQTLADLYPDDEEARQRLLHDTEITADEFIRNDSHDVPVWDFGATTVERRPIAEGETANLWTFLDWTASASSNAAASTMMQHLVLLKHFGRDYPVPREQARAFLKDTPKSELSRIYLDAMQSPLRRNGLDVSKLRQGAFFTREGKNRIPGTNSVSTPLELLRFIVAMEQGKLVDAYSSLEIKKLLYLTDARIRYAAHPALADSAVYFKSGSLYGCKPEPGFQCGKFLGNRLNFMNSMVVIESIDRDPQLRYAVVLLSNVLRKNSSEVHQEIGFKIHRIMEGYHPPRPAAPPPGAATTSAPSGE